MNPHAPVVLLAEIRKMNSPHPFTSRELVHYLEQHYKQPRYHLQGGYRQGRAGSVSGLVISLLRALKTLGYVEHVPEIHWYRGRRTYVGLWKLNAAAVETTREGETT